MKVEVNFLAVLLAAVSSFVVGAIWYSEGVFGAQWRELIKMDRKTMQKGPGGRAWALTVIAALLEAFVLAHITYMATRFYTDRSWMNVALTTAFWMWLGFQLSLVLTHDSFEQRRLKLTMMTAVHQLVSLMVMGVIIGILKV